MTDLLLTLEDIALMHKCSVRHARDVIVKMHGFPAEAPTSTPRMRRWLMSDVRAYLHGNRTRITQPARKRELARV